MPLDIAAVVEQFDLGSDARVIGQPARGEQGIVWQVTSTRGVFAVKRMFEPWNEVDVIGPAAYQELVHAAGVAVPGIVRTVDGAVLADTDGVSMRVYDWVDLCERDPLLDPVSVGALVAAVHHVVSIDGSSVHPWYTEPVGADRWHELTDAAARAGAPFADDLALLGEDLIALEELLEAPAHLQLCHCDLWADNLRATSNGGLCIIDWENCGAADPSQELCLLFYEFGGGDAVRTRDLYRAYVDAGGPARIDRPRNFSMVIAQVAHINEMAITRWLRSDATVDQRAHDAALFGEFVSRPLTRASIADMLDAIS